MVLIAFPMIGFIAYLTFGRSFRRSERYRELPLLMPSKYLTKEPVTYMNRQKYLEIDSEITDIFKAGIVSGDEETIEITLRYSAAECRWNTDSGCEKLHHIL